MVVREGESRSHHTLPLHQQRAETDYVRIARYALFPSFNAMKELREREERRYRIKVRSYFWWRGGEGGGLTPARHRLAHKDIPPPVRIIV